MSYRLHFYTAPVPRYDHEVAFTGDFAVVCGIATDGQMVLPTCDTQGYLVPCGVQGLPYMPELGASGRRVTVLFDRQLVTLVIATASDLRPDFIVKPVPPPVTVVGVAYLGYSANGGKVWRLTYSDGSAANFFGGKTAPAPPPGIIQYDEGSYGLYDYSSGQIYTTDPRPH